MPMPAVSNRAPQHALSGGALSSGNNQHAQPYQKPTGPAPHVPATRVAPQPKPKTAPAGGGSKPPKGPNVPSKFLNQPHGNPMGKGNDHMANQHAMGRAAAMHGANKAANFLKSKKK